MSDTYFDYLVECVIMLGANENRGLLLSKSSKNLSDDIASINFQQQILAALSSKVGLLPFTKNNYVYPLVHFSVKKTSKHFVEKTLNPNKSKDNNIEFQSIKNLVIFCNYDTYKTDKTRQSQNKFNRTKSRRQSLKKTNIDTYSGKLGSVSMETIKNFPSVYFNNNLKVSLDYEEPDIVIIPLTDNLGGRSYAIKLQFYNLYEYFPSDINSEEVICIKSCDQHCSSDKQIYVPFNIVIFSKFPYFRLFKEILNDFYLVACRSGDITKMEKELLVYSSILTRIALIDCYHVNTIFRINDYSYEINIPKLKFNQTVDFDFSLLFNILSIENIILILLAMLQEKNIVFLSNSKNILTICCETILILFKPFTWKFFYLPILPNHLFDLLGAVFPFIIGIPRDLKERILEEYENLFIVDLENGAIIIGKNSGPLFNVDFKLINDVKEEYFKISHLRFDALTYLKFKDSKYLTNNKSEQMFIDSVLHIFMNFFVDLFVEIIPNISVDQRNDGISVNLDKFLNSVSSNVAFFRSISRTDNFLCLIDNIFYREISDNFIKLFNEKYPEALKRQSIKNKSLNGRGDTLESFSSTENFRLSSFQEYYNDCDVEYVTFPTDSEERKSYFELFQNSINGIKNEILKMFYQAEFYLQRNDKISALEQFYLISKKKKNLYNKSKLRKIVRGLRSDEYDQLFTQPFYNEFNIQIEYARESISVNIDMHSVEQFNVPSEDIKYENFYDVCSNGDIAKYEINVENLFTCLTMDSKIKLNNFVKQEIFACFYQNWISSDQDIDVDINSFPGEQLIRYTKNHIRIDGLGTGRIILSQFRLLFVSFGSSKAEQIIDFTKDSIKRLKMDVKLIKALTVFPEVMELHFVTENTLKKLTFWIKDEVEIWYRLINELIFANKLSFKEKDYSIIEQASELCFILENLVACSRSHLYFKKHLINFAGKLMIFSKDENLTPEQSHHYKYICKKLSPSYKMSMSICGLIQVDLELWCACHSDSQNFMSIFKMRNDFQSTSQHLIPEVVIVNEKIQLIAYLEYLQKVLVVFRNNDLVLYDANNKTSHLKIRLEFFTRSIVSCVKPTLNNAEDFYTIYFGSNSGELSYWRSNEMKTKKWTKIPVDKYVSCIEEIADKSILLVSCIHNMFVIKRDSGSIIQSISLSSNTQSINRISGISVMNSNKIIVTKARMPIVLIYEITDSNKVNCIDKFDVVLKQNYKEYEIATRKEISSNQIGISCILNVENSNNKIAWWTFYKNGNIEIIDPISLEKIDYFTGHKGAVETAFVMEFKQNKFVVSVGRDDFKINIWKSL